MVTVSLTQTFGEDFSMKDIEISGHCLFHCVNYFILLLLPLGSHSHCTFLGLLPLLKANLFCNFHTLLQEIQAWVQNQSVAAVSGAVGDALGSSHTPGDAPGYSHTEVVAAAGQAPSQVCLSFYFKFKWLSY